MPEPETPPVDPPVIDPPVTDPPELGEPGKRAIQAERERATKAEREAKTEREAREKLEARLADIDNANKTEQERALDAARKEATDAATATVEAAFVRQINEAKAEARAAGKVMDPADITRFLDPELLGAKGLTNEALDEAISKVLEAKPYLASAASHPANGQGDGGAKGGGVPQLKRDDLQKMTAAQIEDAEAKGQLVALLSGQQQ